MESHYFKREAVSIAISGGNYLLTEFLFSKGILPPMESILDTIRYPYGASIGMFKLVYRFGIPIDDIEILNTACRKSNKYMVKTILKFGFIPNRKSLISSVESKDPEIVKLILNSKRYPRMNIRYPDDYLSALQKSIDLKLEEIGSLILYEIGNRHQLSYQPVYLEMVRLYQERINSEFVRLCQFNSAVRC